MERKEKNYMFFSLRSSRSSRLNVFFLLFRRCKETSPYLECVLGGVSLRLLNNKKTNLTAKSAKNAKKKHKKFLQGFFNGNNFERIHRSLKPINCQ